LASPESYKFQLFVQDRAGFLQYFWVMQKLTFKLKYLEETDDESLMRRVILFLLLMQSISIYAYKINLAGHPSLTNCKGNEAEKYFYCKDDEGSEYLIKEMGWSFAAAKKTKDGKVKRLEVNEIYTDDGTDLFVAEISRATLFDEDNKPPYVGGFADYADELEYLYSDFFRYAQPGEIDPEDKEISKLASTIKMNIEKQEKHYGDLLKSNNLKVELGNGENLNCSRNNKYPACPLLSCGKDSYGNDIIILKDKATHTSYFGAFAFKDGKLAKDHSGIESLLAYTGEVLLTKSREEKSSNPFKKEMLVPSRYKDDPDLFKNLTDHSYVNYLLNEVSTCGKQMVPYFKKVVEQANEDRINSEMVQLIDFANGSLESYYVNEDSLPEFACVHKGVYYSPEGYKKSKDIRGSSKKSISAKKAQEIFDKARARKDIAWNYTFDGCYARAHLMARMFEEEGIHVDKAWLRGSLQVPGESPQMKWGYHVAPLVYVDDGKGGVEEMIIDPSISDKPLSAKEWALKMEVDFSKSDKVVYPTPTNTAFFNKTSFAVTSSEPYWPLLDMELTEDQKISMAKDTMEQYSGGLDHWGEEHEQW